MQNPTLSQEDLITIYKTMQANDGITDVAALTGGGALSRQFLDATLASIVAQASDLKFYKQMPKRSVNQTLLEYTRRENRNDNFFDSGWLNQVADPSFGDVALKRMVEQMTYLSRAFSFSRVATQIQGIADPEVEQTNNALVRTMIDLTRFVFHGDKAINPNEPNGFVQKILALNSTKHVYDCRNMIPSAQVLKEKSAMLAQDYFATPNQMWMPIGTKNLIDNIYTASGQVMAWQNNQANPNSVALSNIVPFVLANEAKEGKIIFETERYIDLSKQTVPMIPNPAGNGTMIEGATGPTAPDMPSIAVAVIAPPVAGSLWQAGDAGAYSYRVAALNQFASVACPASAPQTVAAGGALQITITPALTGYAADAFALFRETAPGNGDFKLFKRIPKTLAPTTVYIDLNEDIPGTGIAILGDFNATSTTDESRTYILSELLPPLKTLFPEGIGGLRIRTGMVEHYCVPQIFTPERFVLFKNIPVR